MFMLNRFDNDAQSRYSAIEGEALVVCWAREKVDFSSMGVQICTLGSIINRSLHFSWKTLNHLTRF